MVDYITRANTFLRGSIQVFMHQTESVRRLIQGSKEPRMLNLNQGIKHF